MIFYILYQERARLDTWRAGCRERRRRSERAGAAFGAELCGSGGIKLEEAEKVR